MGGTQSSILLGFSILKQPFWGTPMAMETTGSRCNYKYLNSGPGAIGGFFVHRKHHDKGATQTRLSDCPFFWPVGVMRIVMEF